MAQHTEVHCKRQGTTQTETVVIQCNRTEGRRRSPTSAPARVHTPADNPDRSRGQRTGQCGDQVCSQALAATSGEVKVRDDLREPQHWVGMASVLKDTICLLGMPLLPPGKSEVYREPGPAKEGWESVRWWM